MLPSDVVTINEVHSPERITKVDAHAEVAAALLHAVHAEPQLPRVAPTCCEGKDGEKLETDMKERQKKSDVCCENYDTFQLIQTQAAMFTHCQKRFYPSLFFLNNALINT